MIYYLSLGANLGDRENTLRQALQHIEQQVGTIRRCSSFFYSTPWGFTSEHDFCNLCCAVETNKSPLDVLSLTQAIERALGRKNKTIDHIYTDRIIDIDLIRVFENNGTEYVMDTPELTLPHRFWQERDFVKLPLSEIMPK